MAVSLLPPELEDSINDIAARASSEMERIEG